MKEYAEAIGEDSKIWAFIDGTTQQICRSQLYQDIFYTDHKSFHWYKWQAVVTPDGLCSSLGKAMEGLKSDWTLYHYSKIEREIVA